jgi:phosphatidylinositol-3-phosphatase
VLATGKAPFLERTARTYGLATHSYGRRHPSFPNYLELIAGTTFGITENCNDCMVDGTTLVDQLERKRIGWKAYMEGADGACYLGDSTSDGYVKKHNPFVHVRHIVDDADQCSRVVPLTELDDDLESSGGAEPFLWVTPNLCHQGHDCGAEEMDRWLSTFLRSVQRSAWYEDGGIVILTWDEGITNAGCCNGAKGGHIPTIVVAEHARGMRLHSPITHAGVLRGIQRLYDLPFLANARCACSGDLFPMLEDPVHRGTGSTGGAGAA